MASPPNILASLQLTYDDGAGAPRIDASFGILPGSLVTLVPFAQWQIEVAAEVSPRLSWLAVEDGQDAIALYVTRLVASFNFLGGGTSVVTLARVDGAGQLTPFVLGVLPSNVAKFTLFETPTSLEVPPP